MPAIEADDGSGQAQQAECPQSVANDELGAWPGTQGGSVRRRTTANAATATSPTTTNASQRPIDGVTALSMAGAMAADRPSMAYAAPRAVARVAPV